MARGTHLKTGIAVFLFAVWFVLAPSAWGANGARIQEGTHMLRALKTEVYNSGVFKAKTLDEKPDAFSQALLNTQTVEEAADLAAAYITAHAKAALDDEEAAWTIGYALDTFITAQDIFCFSLDDAAIEGQYQLVRQFETKSSIPFDPNFNYTVIAYNAYHDKDGQAASFRTWTTHIQDIIVAIVTGMGEKDEEKQIVSYYAELQKELGEYWINDNWKNIIMAWIALHQKWYAISQAVGSLPDEKNLASDQRDNVAYVRKCYEMARDFYQYNDENLRAAVFDKLVYFYDVHTNFGMGFSRGFELSHEDGMYKVTSRFAKVVPLSIYTVSDEVKANINTTAERIQHRIGEKQYKSVIEDPKFIPEWYRMLPKLEKNAAPRKTNGK